MKSFNSLTSACRYCQHYEPEGRRGGHCQQLGVPVRGSWKSCSLASPAFASSWASLEEIMIWSDESLRVPDTLPLKCSLACSELSASEPENSSTARAVS